LRKEQNANESYRFPIRGFRVRVMVGSDGNFPGFYRVN
jgi:hypothetical protein